MVHYCQSIMNAVNGRNYTIIICEHLYFLLKMKKKNT